MRIAAHSLAQQYSFTVAHENQSRIDCHAWRGDCVLADIPQALAARLSDDLQIAKDPRLRDIWRRNQGIGRDSRTFNISELAVKSNTSYVT
jgi:hypothetical protein